MNDILSGITPIISNTESEVAQEQDYIDELRRTKKKLKKAKRKGKRGKKQKRRIKKLNKKVRRLNKVIAYIRRMPPVVSQRGRWDTVIEKSVPELIKFATVVVDRRLPPSKGR